MLSQVAVTAIFCRQRRASGGRIIEACSEATFSEKSVYRPSSERQQGQVFPLSEKFVPPSLKAHKIWILWKIVEKDGRVTKIPISAAPGLPWARSNRPEDWTDFATAEMFRAKNPELCLGVMLPADKSILFVDLDDSVNDAGELSATAKDVLRMLPSCYCERSVSGHGLHLLCQGTIPRNSKNSALGVELYNSKRFAALTFDCIREADVVSETRIDELFARYASKGRPQAKIRPNVGPPSADDEDIIREIEANEKYGRLWAGKWQGRFGSHSEADLSLLNYLAYLTDRNPAQMQRLFERSGLVREKWHLRPDYRARTIATAILGCAESRSERQRRRRAEMEVWLNE